MATLLPNGKQQFLDASGAPLVGGKVYFYIPGTTTPKDTYQDAGATILNTNPVTLDSAGEAVIYGSGAYRQIVNDADGVTIWDQLTADTSSAQSSWSGASTGTANAQAVTAANFTSDDGQQISFLAGYTNSGSTTLNVNGAGPISIKRDTASGPVNLVGGEIVAGGLCTVTYDSGLGAFHLFSMVPAFNAATVAAAALPKAGGTMTGDLVLYGSAPATSASAAPKSYVDTKVAAVLPSQTSKNYTYYLGTDGTNPVWRQTQPVTVSASLLTLTGGPSLGAGSLNAASCSVPSTGVVRLTFTNALASTNYQVAHTVVNSGASVVAYQTNKATGYVELAFVNTATGAATNPTAIDVIIFGGN